MPEPGATRGVILNRLGRYEDALQAYEKALELNPKSANAWFNMACSHSLKGNKDRALVWLRKAIDVDSSYKEKAKTDGDFQSLWADPDFKKLVE